MERHAQDIRRDARAVVERDDLMIARVCAVQMAARIVKALHVIAESPPPTVHRPPLEVVGRSDDAPAPRA